MAARPAPTEPIPERVVLVGCAGSGKTTFARALAGRVGARRIERDALGDDEDPGFASRVAAAVDAAGPRWVFDGAPYDAEMLVYPHEEIAELFARPELANARRLRFTSPRQAAIWLVNLRR